MPYAVLTGVEPAVNIRRNLIWYCAAPLVAFGCLLLALLPMRPDRYSVIGYLFGTVFGHATLAAAWTAFGPLRVAWRLPLSLLWLGSLVAACGFPFRGDGDVVLNIMCCMFGQFLLLQLPFWGLAIGYRLRLRHNESASQAPDPRVLQFGIRDLLIFTTIIAVLLGLGRLTIGIAPSLIAGLGHEAPIFIFLGLAAIVMTLPLVLAALLPRLAVPAVIMAIVFIGIVTASELPLLSTFNKGPGPDMYHIVWINGFTAAWILAVVLVVRMSGYRLTRGQR